jgi:hypothetical protein
MPEDNRSLNHIPDRDDIGSDTLRRFRCQAAYAATLSLELLNPTSEFEELFCEHYEDILIRKKDKSFIGIQVKTRESGRELFKSTDSEIVNSLKRFVEHYIQFPDQYSNFLIATNYAFWVGKRNYKNLNYLLQSAQSVLNYMSSQISHGLLSYIKVIKGQVDSELQSKVNEDIILKVLALTRLEDNLPKFDDIEIALVRCIPERYHHNGVCFDDLLRTSKKLINQMIEAGSLTHVSPRNTYFSLFSNSTQTAVDAAIAGKRITKDKINNILTELLDEQILLSTTTQVNISDLPRGMRTMELKMAKGRVSAENILRSKDHKYSTDLLISSWIYKYGPEKAVAQYKHLFVIVANECQEAYDDFCRRGQPFGQNMLIQIREHLRSRYEQDQESFFGCKYEHVLGVMGILTEMCEVWWSEKFEIPEEAKV